MTKVVFSAHLHLALHQARVALEAFGELRASGTRLAASLASLLNRFPTGPPPDAKSPPPDPRATSSQTCHGVSQPHTGYGASQPQNLPTAHPNGGSRGGLFPSPHGSKGPSSRGGPKEGLPPRDAARLQGNATAFFRAAQVASPLFRETLSFVQMLTSYKS